MYSNKNLLKENSFSMLKGKFENFQKASEVIFWKVIRKCSTFYISLVSVCVCVCVYMNKENDVFG